MKSACIRMPAELYAALRRAAQEDRRSVTSMVIVLIEEALRKRQITPNRVTNA